MKKDTTEAHYTTDADWEYEKWEDEEWDYPDEGYFEESHLAGDLDDEEECPVEHVDASVEK